MAVQVTYYANKTKKLIGYQSKCKSSTEKLYKLFLLLKLKYIE